MKIASAQDMIGLKDMFVQSLKHLGIEEPAVLVCQPRADNKITIIMSGTIDIWGKEG